MEGIEIVIPTHTMESFELEPRGSWVLLEEEKVKTSIEVLGSGAPREYRVVKCGPGRYVGETWTELALEPGAKVVFDSRGAWPTFRTDGRVLFLVPEDAIFATYTGTKDI